MTRVVLIAHNLRSTHNVGSILRTADGLGVSEVYLTGYTPYPLAQNDSRLPHIITKLTHQIHKTALGAEGLVAWQHKDDIFEVLSHLKSEGYLVVALEQAKNSIPLAGFKPPDKIALIVGREVTGIEPDVLKKADSIIEIPMMGQKESFNVAQAAAMALYHIRFLAD